MFSFLFCCWFLTVCGKRVKGVLCSQNPCVFFSYVYVDLNVVVFIFGGVFCLFGSCKEHKHQWHVNHVANQAECIPLLCPDRHPLTIVYKTSRAFPFHVSPFLTVEALPLFLLL